MFALDVNTAIFVKVLYILFYCYRIYFFYNCETSFKSDLFFLHIFLSFILWYYFLFCFGLNSCFLTPATNNNKINIILFCLIISYYKLIVLTSYICINMETSGYDKYDRLRCNRCWHIMQQPAAIVTSCSHIFCKLILISLIFCFNVALIY